MKKNVQSSPKKPDYKQEYLNDFIGLTGITDLTLQDVYGALIHLTERGQLPQRGRSLWSKSQFEALFRALLDTENPYRDMKHEFKDAVEETRWRRSHRKPEEPEELFFPEEDNPEEDMEAMSDELLRADDIGI